MSGLDEGALTHRRHERKIALAPEQAAELLERLGLASRIASVAEERVISVYFDLPSGRLAALALASPQSCLKVRTKEYDPDRGAPASPRCVVELKRRRGTLTRKDRYWVGRSELAEIFAALGAPRSSSACAARHALSPFGAGALRPLVAISYLRRVLALGPGLRMTFDRDIAFHRAGAGVLLGPAALAHAWLPAPFAREPRVILEIKHLGAAAPEWAAPLLAAHEAGYSKFGTAVVLLQRCDQGPARASG